MKLDRQSGRALGGRAVRRGLYLLVAVALATLGVSAVALPAGAASGPNKLIIVYMENHDLADITSSAGAAAMPYLNSLWDNTAAWPTEQFTNYSAVDHPSFPNYAAMATGETVDASDTNFTAGQFTNPTVWSQLSAAGDSWGSSTAPNRMRVILSATTTTPPAPIQARTR